jgi:hypothetical protein
MAENEFAERHPKGGCKTFPKGEHHVLSQMQSQDWIVSI